MSVVQKKPLSQEEFVYKISHDTKQHVNQILTISELLLERSKNLNDDEKRYLDMIREAGREMKAVIDGLTREAAQPVTNGNGHAATTSAAATQTTQKTPASGSESGKKVMLVVEDDEDDYMLLKEIFEEGSKQVTLQWAKDGEEAIRFLSEHGALDSASHPVLVLLDLNMPKVDGLEVLKQIRANKEWSHMPVAIFTNSMNQKEALEAYRSGANAFIRKPSGYKDLQYFVKSFQRYWFEYSTLV